MKRSCHSDNAAVAPSSFVPSNQNRKTEKKETHHESQSKTANQQNHYEEGGVERARQGV
jgi:hypothetical protein